MTRKDYKLIADALKNAQPAPHWSLNKHAQHRVDCNRIADALQSDNPRFDRVKFLDACGEGETP